MAGGKRTASSSAAATTASSSATASGARTIPHRVFDIDASAPRGKAPRRGHATHTDSDMLYITEEVWQSRTAIGLLDAETQAHLLAQGTGSSDTAADMGVLGILGGATQSTQPTRPSSARRTNAATVSETKNRKAWEQAFAPLRSLFMTGFMLWMSGSSVHIFSIMFTFMAFFNPLKAIAGVNAQFDPFADKGSDVTLPKLVFVAANLLGVAMATYKTYVLGLLPTQEGDYVAWLALRASQEITAGGVLA